MNWRLLRRYVLPSRTIGRYMVRLLLTRFFGLLIGLTAVLQVLDLLAQSDDIMAATGATYGSILSYLSLRLPELISQFIPFSALLATLLTLATLNQSSEITIMKAMGMSAHRILFPLGIACALITTGHFVFNETVLVKASAELDWWRSNNFAVDLPPNSGATRKLWLQDGDHFVYVQNVSRLAGGVVLDEVSIFEKKGSGQLEALSRADFAVHQNGKWTLHNVHRFDTDTHGLEVTDTMNWPLDIAPDKLGILKINPKHHTANSLLRAIKALDEEGLPTARLFTSFLQKFAGPASTILMPLLGAIAAFGVSRRGNLMLRVIGGMALGFSFFVADNFMLAMGEFGVSPPFLSAWAPFFLFLMVGYTVIFSTEEGQFQKLIRKSHGR